MSCLEADTVARLFAQRLSVDERREVDAHVDGCASCRQWIAAVARDRSTEEDVAEPTLEASRAAGTEPAAHHVVLRVGDQVSRYRIEGFLGAGAMGAVYEARDPELDRRVALKTVPVNAGSPAEGRAGRLVREAQAMARLSHPNIVPIHDAGRSAGVAFIAMQRVDGVSLREHLATVRSTPAARLQLLCAAGRGLATAHDAGIVHRDLKPDNILIDRGGTALVGDFGLARLPDELDEPVLDDPVAVAASGDGASSAAAAGSDWRTAAGTILGTPGYMAPEVKRGARGDALADQFSFAVTLAEALGARPGDDRALQRLPRRVRRVVKRALSDDPRRRFPSMTAMLHALEPRVTVARAAIVVGVIAAVAGAVALASRTPPQDVVAACRRAAEDRLHGEWNRGARQALEAHLLALPAPGGTTAITAAALDRLERYAGAWLAMRQEVCEATGVRGEQTATLRDLRMSCLDERLVELAAVRRTLGSLAATELAVATGLGALLGDLAQCADARNLARRTPYAPNVVAKALELKRALVEANATIMRGRITELTGGVATGYEAAERVASGVLTEARAARLPVIEADALRIRAGLVGRGEGTGDPTGYYEALAIGDRLGDPAIRCDSLIGLLAGAAQDPARAGEVAVVSRLLETAIAELPGAQHERHARLSGNLAVFHDRRGELELAEQRARETVVHFDEARGRSDPYSLNGRQLLAGILFARGKLDDARRARAEMRAATRDAYGERSPYFVLVLIDEGKELASAGLAPEADASLREALAMAEALYGVDHEQIALILRVRGFLRLASDPAAARQDFARALEILEGKGKPVQLAALLLGLGQAALGAGDAAAAVPSLERGLTLLSTGRGSQQLGPPARFALARALWQTGGDRRRARALATQALAEFRSVKGPWKVDEVTREASAWLEAHR